MLVGIIDVDGHSFPNLPLMKISAWHKLQGDTVKWYEPLDLEHYDRVYMSKVFSFTPDYQFPVYADEVVQGGSGYCIKTVNGVEVYDKTKDKPLPYEVEHIFPDYSIYGITDTAYGFLSRGCPRGCAFCHVATKEGQCAYKVADLAEFWSGQENIVVCDPNILACKEWEDLLGQLADSKSDIDFNQGLDIRLMTPEKAEALSKVKTKMIHFAWDRYEDKRLVLPKLKTFRERSKISPHSLVVYVLVNFDSTLAEDLERVYTLRDMGFAPYVMIYNKEELPKGHVLRKLQRYVNNRTIFYSCSSFDEYQKQDAVLDPNQLELACI